MGSPIAIRELKNILSINNDTNTNKFEIFTDGSLIKRSNNIPLMGLGWVLLDKDNNSILNTFNCSSINWHSTTTHAESLSILTTLSTIPRDSSVIINTDSQNCIDNFNRLVFNTVHMHKFQKIKNYAT